MDDFKEKEGAAAKSTVATEREAITASLRGLPGRLRVAFAKKQGRSGDPRRITTKGDKWSLYVSS